MCKEENMKFLKVNSKYLIFATIIWLAGVSSYCVADVPAYTQSIKGIHCHFDKCIAQEFKCTFKDSFSENSTEKLNITVKKMLDGKQKIQTFVKDLEATKLQLKHEHKVDTALFAFIIILLKIAEDLEKYFNTAYNTLTAGLAKKLKAAAFATELTKMSKTIATDENFNRMDNYLSELQQIAECNGEKDVVNEIAEIRDDMKKILAQYKSKSKDNAAALAALRKRLP